MTENDKLKKVIQGVELSLLVFNFLNLETNIVLSYI